MASWHAEKDAYFWNDLCKEFEVEFVHPLFQALFRAIAIRLRLVREFLG